MTIWEYKIIVWSREWKESQKKYPYDIHRSVFIGCQWCLGEMSQNLNDLGKEGWELVSISPRSSFLGGHENTDVKTITNDFAGFTSEEVWVFKRPKNIGETRKAEY
jgi:hypothetical protein